MTVSTRRIERSESEGPTGIAFDADDGSRRYTCRLHPEIEPFDAGGVCEQCCYGNPKRPADIDIQDWWQPAASIPTLMPRTTATGGSHLDHTIDGGPGYRCTVHDRHFALDEMCRRCADDDE